MKWYYWRTEEWNGMPEAHNGKNKWTWVPECGYWCWPEEISDPSITIEQIDQGYIDNGYWVRTSPLEYLIKTGKVLPPPPETMEEADHIWEEFLKGADRLSKGGTDEPN